jgi:hypothetical protein
MIGVILNSKVKIINRDKYISLHGEDSVSKSNVFGKFVTVKYCFENGEKFLCADDQGKEYILFSDCIAYVDHVKERSILDEAKDIRSNSRQSDYGDAVVNFENISKMASLITGKELSPYDCVAVQIAVKLCRQGFHKKRDNMVDLAGYADIMQLIVDRENVENGEKG